MISIVTGTNSDLFNLIMLANVSFKQCYIFQDDLENNLIWFFVNKVKILLSILLWTRGQTLPNFPVLMQCNFHGGALVCPPPPRSGVSTGFPLLPAGRSLWIDSCGGCYRVLLSWFWINPVQFSSTNAVMPMGHELHPAVRGV